MLNQVVLIGRLGGDPELRYTPSGVAVSSFSLAVNRPRRPDSETEPETDWFKIIVWREVAERTANYLVKGRLVAIQGRLQTRSWVGQDGLKRNVVEIVAQRVYPLDKPKEQVGAPVGAEEGEQPVAAAAPGLEHEADYDPFAEE